MKTVGSGSKTASSLGERCEVGTKSGSGMLNLLVAGGFGSGGGKICGDGGGGGRSDGDEDGSFDFWDSNHGNDGTDLYYQKMIEANPGNSLLLSNYARFLKEVKHYLFVFALDCFSLVEVCAGLGIDVPLVQQSPTLQKSSAASHQPSNL